MKKYKYVAVMGKDMLVSTLLWVKKIKSNTCCYFLQLVLLLFFLILFGMKVIVCALNKKK